jgi:hypothetical protein
VGLLLSVFLCTGRRSPLPLTWDAFPAGRPQLISSSQTDLRLVLYRPGVAPLQLQQGNKKKFHLLIKRVDSVFSCIMKMLISLERSVGVLVKLCKTNDREDCYHLSWSVSVKALCRF